MIGGVPGVAYVLSSNNDIFGLTFLDSVSIGLGIDINRFFKVGQDLLVISNVEVLVSDTSNSSPRSYSRCLLKGSSASSSTISSSFGIKT